MFDYATKLLLHILSIDNIAYIKVVAMTGNVYGGGQERRWGKNPELEIVLNNGMKYRAEMKGDKYKGKRYEIELYVYNDFTPSLVCTHEDIKEVSRYRWVVRRIDRYLHRGNK